MSSFKFNFSGDVNSPQIEKLNDEEAEERISDNVDWDASVEVIPGNQGLEDVTRAEMFVCGDLQIGHVVAKEALLKIGDNGFKSAVELADKEHSDLIPGKYEGGLKIWECTSDLMKFLVGLEKRNLKNQRVLDLGCGAGILGIYCLMNGAFVTFQDYNKEVLESVTIPNIFLNAEDEDEIDITKCKFYSGDWASFNKVLPESEVFNMILTSETIYNPDNYQKLVDLFIQRLSKDGVVYAAAKTCYFGVGGGTREFQKLIEKTFLLNCETCWSSVDGIKREILKITRNQSLLLFD